MLETAAMILAGYAGYAAWPWWSAAVLGAVAGVWNACTRLRSGAWRERWLEVGATRSAALWGLVFVCVWTGTLSAALLTGIYFAVRLVSRAFT